MTECLDIVSHDPDIDRARAILAHRGFQHVLAEQAEPWKPGEIKQIVAGTLEGSSPEVGRQAIDDTYLCLRAAGILLDAPDYRVKSGVVVSD